MKVYAIVQTNELKHVHCLLLLMKPQLLKYGNREQGLGLVRCNLGVL